MLRNNWNYRRGDIYLADLGAHRGHIQGGISLEHLSRMERGKRKRSIDWIATMACCFHVRTDCRFTGNCYDNSDGRTRFLNVQRS